MKIRFASLLLVLTTMLFTFGCSWFKGAGNKLVLTYKTAKDSPPITKEVSVKQSFMTSSEITTAANGQAARIVLYSIQLANYDASAATLEREMPNTNDQIKVEIQVVGPGGTSASTALKIGTFPAAQVADGIDQFNKVLNIKVSLFENGKVQDQGISVVNPRKGFVKINSVTDKLVSGEIDMSDDFRSVKGQFTATIITP